jgi:lipopolysaccharide transport system ATP-binding protein
VIAHVNADILIVDEALAVGDAVFTQKCMRFIRKFKENGSLLFVSHDMSSVLSLCERAVWLHQGQIREIGESKSVAESYLQYTLQEVYGEEARLSRVGKEKTSTPPSPHMTLDYQAQMQVCDNLHEANGWKTGAGEIVSVRLLRVEDNEESEESPILKGGERLCMTVRAVIHEPLQRPILGFLIRDRLGQDLFGENTLPFTTATPTAASAGDTLRADFTFVLPMLPNGQYSVMVSLADGDLGQHVQHHWLHDALILNVSSSKVRWGLVGLRFDDVTLQLDK